MLWSDNIRREHVLEVWEPGTFSFNVQISRYLINNEDNLAGISANISLKLSGVSPHELFIVHQWD